MVDGHVVGAAHGAEHLDGAIRDPLQWENLWSDPARAGLKGDLIADLYDNLPAARSPALAQVAPV